MEEKVEKVVEEVAVEEVAEEVQKNFDEANANLERIQKTLEENEVDEVVENIKKDGEELRKSLEDEVEELKQKLFEQEVSSTLKDNGLEMFEGLVHVGDAKQLDEVVHKLTQIVNDIKLSNAYIPSDNAKQDAYTQHANNKDTKNMIGSKLAKLFK